MNSNFLNQESSQEDIINYALSIAMRKWSAHKILPEEIDRFNHYLRQLKKALIDQIKKRQRAGRITEGFIFTFHANMDEEEAMLNFKHMETKNQRECNYEEMIGLHFEKALQTNESYLWVLVTDKLFRPQIPNLAGYLADGSICIARCNIKTSELMFERAIAASSVAHLIGERLNGVFLDGDAFLMNDLSPIWNINGDILLTIRQQSQANNIVPINEGVYFTKRGKESILFFKDYIKIYSILAADENLYTYYGKSVKRWRGGQLAINIMSRRQGFLNQRYQYTSTLIPCHRFNAMPKIHSPIDPQKKFVIHIKGNKKDFDIIKSSLKSGKNKCA